MDDAVLVSAIPVFFFIACCIYNSLSVLWRTINWWLLDLLMQFQDTCGVHRAGHVKCVYIFIYVCIYNIPEFSVYWILGAAHPRSLGMSASTCVTWHGEDRVWQLHRSVPSADRAFFFFSPLSLEEPLLLQFSDRRLESGAWGWIQWAGGRIFPLASLLCCVETNVQPWCRQSDFCSVWMYGLHRRLEFICTNYTWGPLDGIKISFLLTCIKFYF